MSIEQLLSDHNIEYENKGRHSSRGWANINCPFCGDTTFHGGVNLTGGYYNCWTCGSHSFSYVLSVLLYIPKKESTKLIEEYLQYNSPVVTSSKKRSGVPSLKMIGAPLRPLHKKYLKSRGFDWKGLVSKYDLTGTTYHPSFPYRVIIPIYYHKQLVSYQGRDVTGKSDLRYKGLSPDDSVIPYKHLLYGSQFAGRDQIGIVEGVFDQWRMGDGFVCTFGTDLTSYQLQLLSKYKKLIFLYDTGALKKAMSFAKQLKAINIDIDVEVVDLELGERDPGDLSPEEAFYYRKELNFV